MIENWNVEWWINLQCVCTSFSNKHFVSHIRSWILWAHDSLMMMMKIFVQADKIVNWLIIKSYCSLIFLRAYEETKIINWRKIDLLRRIDENRVLASSKAMRWSWSWLFNKNLISFITILRSFDEDLNWRFKIAWSFSLREITMMSKCKNLLIKQVTNWRQLAMYVKIRYFTQSSCDRLYLTKSWFHNFQNFASIDAYVIAFHSSKNRVQFSLSSNVFLQCASTLLFMCHKQSTWLMLENVMQMTLISAFFMSITITFESDNFNWK
jgi:hypothetical protein